MATCGTEVAPLADRVRRDLHLTGPPVDAPEMVAAYQLSLPDVPLEEVLEAAGLKPTVIQKLDAMLNPAEGCIFVRDDMHDRRKNWGYLHELGHYVIPWHSDLLYHCPILRLPPRLQKQFEVEADQFAADVFFFGDRFIEEAMSRPFGLRTPMQLADERYDSSLHAAFVRYTEENPRKCCLFVSRPLLNEDTGLYDLKLRYYVKSRGFPGHYPPRQIISAESRLGQLFNAGALTSVVEHDLMMGGSKPKTFRANSFTNGYDVFTLIWDPK